MTDDKSYENCRREHEEYLERWRNNPDGERCRREAERSREEWRNSPEGRVAAEAGAHVWFAMFDDDWYPAILVTNEPMSAQEVCDAMFEWNWERWETPILTRPTPGPELDAFMANIRDRIPQVVWLLDRNGVLSCEAGEKDRTRYYAFAGHWLELTMASDIREASVWFATFPAACELLDQGEGEYATAKENSA
jgi:hypothetical protein